MTGLPRDTARSEAARAKDELAQAARHSRGLFWVAILFSIFVNLLMLTGPLYMLQIYDRVLGSQSEATLIALSGLVVFLFLSMGLLDHARGRILARIGAGLQARLDQRVFKAALARQIQQPGDPLAASAQRDLEAMARLWSSPVAAALIDLPWTPLFLAAIFVFHPWMGWFAIAGGALLVALAMLNQSLGQEPILQANAASIAAERRADQLKYQADTLRALGMSAMAFQRWHTARLWALKTGLISADVNGSFATLTRTLRLFLQSAILGLGAYLVLQGEITAGAMIAGSIILGRSLAPIEQAIGHWAVLTRAREGRRNIRQLLTLEPPEPVRTALPRPKGALSVEELVLMLPGQAVPALRNLSFRLEPGQALGIIGPTGAGKSTLARALVGALRPAAGKIRLDGAELSHYDPQVLGSYIGYLPQQVALFETTIAENIARLAIKPDAAQVVNAAKAAAAHEVILKLPMGYDTVLSPLTGQLSGGQVQRVGLARALYGAPVLLVLDEPNSNLDNEGSVALNGAIRQMKAAGNSVIVIAHRPAAIQECDLLLVIEEGLPRAFGPRDDVLRGLVKNHTDITKAKVAGGVL